MIPVATVCTLNRFEHKKVQIKQLQYNFIKY